MNKYDCGIYVIVNLINSKRYIGSTKSFIKRFSEHRRNLIKGKHHNKHLQSSWDKYKSENFEFKKLIICEPKDLIMYEQIFMDYYKSHDNEFGYNIRKIAEDNTGLVPHNKGKPMSEEQKKRLLECHLGKPLSEEHKQKIRNKLKGRDTLTKEQHMEVGRKNRERLTGRILSPESIKKREETRKQRWLNGEYSYTHSETTRNKMSEARKGKIPWNKGIPVSEETRLKQSNAKKGKIQSEESKLKRSLAMKETLRIKREKQRILNESIMFEAQSKLQNTLFNV